MDLTNEQKRDAIRALLDSGLPDDAPDYQTDLLARCNAATASVEEIQQSLLALEQRRSELQHALLRATGQAEALADMLLDHVGVEVHGVGG